MAEVNTTAKKKKAKRSVPTGQVHILATFNNTIITFTDAQGGALRGGIARGVASAHGVAVGRAGTQVAVGVAGGDG